MSGRIVSEEVLVTPEIAREYLTHNTHNRKISEGKVLLYAEQMKRGQWSYNAENIKFSSDGVLLDGQHRLYAVIEANTPVMMLVSRGIDDKMAFATIDIGRNRTPGDAFSVARIPNAIGIAASISKFCVLRRGNIALANQTVYKTAATRQDLWDEYHSSPELWQDVYTSMKGVYKKTIKLLPVSDLTAFSVYLIKMKFHSFETVKGFFIPLMTGTDFTNPSIRLLREALLNEKLNHVRYTPTHRQNLIVKAWNNYIQGKKPTRLRLSSTATYLFL